MFDARRPAVPIELGSILAPARSARVEDVKLVRIARYWQDQAPAGRLPGRRDIDPAGLRDLLPFVFLIDVESEPRRFRFRLIGTGITQFAGRDITGRLIDRSTYGAYGGLAQAVLSLAVDSGKPVLCRGQAVYNPSQTWQRVELLILPLAADGTTVNMLMGGYTTVRSSADAGRQPDITMLDVIPDPILLDGA